MGITTEGVKGYEYQYKVTVLIALIHEAKNIKLFVEKEGSEDALLVIEEGGQTIHIEIQVKRENNLLDIKKVVNWLSHFQERKSDNNLLQKLISEEQSLVLFVTHSRCSDSLLQLKTNFNEITIHDSITINEELFIEFKQNLKTQQFGSSELMKNRKLFCIQQSENLVSKDNLNDILKKCLILEEFNDDTVDNNIINLLNSKFSVS